MHNFYIKSLEESLAAAREYCASDATTCTPVPPAFNPLTRLQTKLVEQCKQVLEVMAQNASLMAALSKGGGGGNGGGSGSSSSRGKGGHTLPQLQQGGCPQSRGVFLRQGQQGQTPHGMGHQMRGMTGTGVPGL
jgi:hypothetical protein